MIQETAPAKYKIIKRVFVALTKGKRLVEDILIEPKDNVGVYIKGGDLYIITTTGKYILTHSIPEEFLKSYKDCITKVN